MITKKIKQFVKKLDVAHLLIYALLHIWVSSLITIYHSYQNHAGRLWTAIRCMQWKLNCPKTAGGTQGLGKSTETKSEELRISRIKALTDGSSIRPQHESGYRRHRHGHKIRMERWRREGDATSIREGHAVAAQSAVQAKLWVSDTQGWHKLSILIVIGEKMMAGQEEFMASAERHCGTELEGTRAT
jgi:hypothetical protein